MSTDHRVAIIGAGFAGLGAAIRLKAAGIDDFVMFERANDVGGTWRANTCPGCPCDVPAHLDCYSFAGNPNWTRTFSPQPEIWSYLRACVERYRLGCKRILISNRHYPALVAAVRGRARGTVWESGGCASWSLDAGGHTVLWPQSARRFRRALSRFDLTSDLARPYSSSS